MVALTFHAANRILERKIPFAALKACRIVEPILTEKPLRFRYKGLVIVACKVGEVPRMISVWKDEKKIEQTGSGTSTHFLSLPPCSR